MLVRLGCLSFVVVVVIAMLWLCWFGSPDEGDLHEGGVDGFVGCFSVVVVLVSQ